MNRNLQASKYIVADFVMSETATRADVVLPVTQWAVVKP